MHQTLYIFLLINIIICFTSLGEHLKIRQVSVGTLGTSIHVVLIYKLLPRSFESLQ